MKKTILLLSFIIFNWSNINGQGKLDITAQIRPRFQLNDKDFSGEIKFDFRRYIYER